MITNRFKTTISLAVAIVLFGGCQNQPTPQKTVVKKIEVKKTKQEIEKERLLALKQKELQRQKELEKQKQRELAKKKRIEQQKIIKFINNNFKNNIESLKKYTLKKGVVYDNTVTWQDNNKVKTLKLNLKDAKKYCKNLNYKNNTDWYLPSKYKLGAIVDKKRKPMIKKEFKNIAKYYYWTNSMNTSDTSQPIVWDFRDGKSYWSDKDDLHYVRCVRDGRILTNKTYQNYKLYKSITGKTKNLTDKLLYSKKPFNEVQSLTQRLVNMFSNITKSEYETKATFQSKIKYIKHILPSKIEEWQQSTFDVVMGGFKFEKRSYDAETATMYVTMKAVNANYSKKISIKVPTNKARMLSENISSITPKPIFEFKGNQIVLKSIGATYEKVDYIAVLNKRDFKPEHITVAIKDIYKLDVVAYKDGKEIKGHNFEDDIPELLSKIKSTKIDSKKWLFTIGIENYSETDDIKYSKRSAELFKKVAKKTLGIKERNCYTLINRKATGTAIKNRLRLLLTEVKKGDTIYFYYNGHGIPDSSSEGEPYMLPSDGIPDFIVSEKEFSLKNIYKKLSDSKASKVVAFVDSCFSGATDGVSIIKGVAGSRLAPKKVIFDKSKMVVISAGQKKQYSNMHKEKGHRMFSYFVMKSLLDGKKDIDMLYKEVSYKVSETSNELGALKKQEPTLDGNSKIKL